MSDLGQVGPERASRPGDAAARRHAPTPRPAAHRSLAPHRARHPTDGAGPHVGHASTAITLDRYGHLYPGDAHLHVDRIGEVALAARADHLRSGDVSTTPTGPEEDAGNGV